MARTVLQFAAWIIFGPETEQTARPELEAINARAISERVIAASWRLDRGLFPGLSLYAVASLPSVKAAPHCLEIQAAEFAKRFGLAPLDAGPRIKADGPQRGSVRPDRPPVKKALNVGAG